MLILSVVWFSDTFAYLLLQTSYEIASSFEKNDKNYVVVRTRGKYILMAPDYATNFAKLRTAKLS